MNIFSAAKNDYIHIQNFLIPYEHTCVLLASYVRKESKHLYIISQKTTITETDDIVGIIYLDKTLLHCLPTVTAVNNREPSPSFSANTELKETLYLFFLKPENKVICINGEKTASDYLAQILSELDYKPEQSNQYKLMTLEQPVIPPSDSLSNGDEIIRCTENDIDLLLDLQKKYITKEVAPAGKQVTDLECRLSLKQILKNQLCFALYSDGEIVAKANTNAIGLHWIQIGGVFTHPLYRRNHYAWHLVSILCKRIQKTERKICLFVKDRNTSAHQLYLNLGFTVKQDFSIIYY